MMVCGSEVLWIKLGDRIMGIDQVGVQFYLFRDLVLGER